MRPDFCPQGAPSLVDKRELEAAQKLGSVGRSPIRAWQTWGRPPPHPTPTSHGFSLSLSLLLYKMGIIIRPSRGHAESFREKQCAWHRSAWEPALFIVCWHISHPATPSPPPSAPESHCRTSCQLGFQEGSCGLPSPTAQPPSVAAAALCWLGTCSGKVKAMLPLAVIGDDNSILSLVETGRDQSRHKGAAATGRNAPANATNYRKLAALRTITIQGCLASPSLPQRLILDGRGESVPQGWWEDSRNSKGFHGPRPSFSVDYWPGDRPKGSLGMFSGQKGSRGPGKICGERR